MLNGSTLSLVATDELLSFQTPYPCIWPEPENWLHIFMNKTLAASDPHALPVFSKKMKWQGLHGRDATNTHRSF